MNLIQTLEKAQNSGQIRRWFCAITEHESLSIGLQNAKIGGVYNPPNKKRTRNAQLLLEMDDEKIVRSSLSREEMEREKVIEKLRPLAIREEDPPLFPERKELPEVQIFSPELKAQVEGQASPLIHLLKIMQQTIRAKVSLTGKGQVSYNHLTVHHSEGWNLESESTSTSIYGQVDGLWGFSNRSRTVLDSNLVETRSRCLAESVENLHKETTPPAGIPMIFSDSFAGDLVQKYIFSNLSAHRVALGLSCFSKDHLKTQQPIFSSSLNLRFEALRPFHPASFRVNSDGTVGQNLDLISQGQIINSIADLKGAALLHCTPTPLPSVSGLVWNTEKEEVLEQLNDDFLLIDGALGLHTQDATTGSFSLAVPNASLISKGKIVGRCRGRIQGNFFELLNLPLTSLTSQMMDHQGLFITQGVQFIPDHP